jgi:hypothetical protein
MGAFFRCISTCGWVKTKNGPKHAASQQEVGELLGLLPIRLLSLPLFARFKLMRQPMNILLKKLFMEF